MQVQFVESAKATQVHGLAVDEKITPFMVYTPSRLCWGGIVSKENVEPGRVLSGAELPDYLTIHNAQVVSLRHDGATTPRKYGELHVPTDEVEAYHLMPEQKEALDYDPNEPERVMEPVSVLVGPFIFAGQIRRSAHTDLRRMLDSARSNFISLYETRITHPSNPRIEAVEVAIAHVRRTSVFFAGRTQN